MNGFIRPCSIVARLFSRAKATIISAALAVWRSTRSIVCPWKVFLPNPSVSRTLGVLASIAGAYRAASSHSPPFDARTDGRQLEFPTDDNLIDSGSVSLGRRRIDHGQAGSEAICVDEYSAESGDIGVQGGHGCNPHTACGCDLPAGRDITVTPALVVDGVEAVKLNLAIVDLPSHGGNHLPVLELMKPSARGGRDEDRKTGMSNDKQLHVTAEAGRTPLVICPVHGFLSLSPAVFRVCVEFDPASVSAAAPRRGLNSIECDPAHAGSQWLAPGPRIAFRTRAWRNAR